MKPIDNRQNKLMQTKAQVKQAGRERQAPPMISSAESSAASLTHGGAVYALVSNLLSASKIAQSAKHCHLSVHNFDKTQPLLEHAKKKAPLLVILDWDGCEAEAFKLLKEFHENADLKAVPTIGYVSHVKTALREEAQRAGCHRVYPKSEFTRILDELLARYAQ